LDSADKIKLLRRHLIEKVAISTVCDEAGLAPSLFHRWHEQLFGNAALGNRRAERGQDRQRIEELKQKIRQKDEVLAELTGEHLSLKKELGEL